MLPQALRAAGDAKYPMVVSMFSMWIFRVGFSVVLGTWMNLGLMGVWFAMFIDWIVRDIFFIARFSWREMADEKSDRRLTAHAAPQKKGTVRAGPLILHRFYIRRMMDFTHFFLQS